MTDMNAQSEQRRPITRSPGAGEERKGFGFGWRRGRARRVFCAMGHRRKKGTRKNVAGGRRGYTYPLVFLESYISYLGQGWIAPCCPAVPHRAGTEGRLRSDGATEGR